MRLLYLILFLFIFTTNVHAQSYLIYDNNTSEIISFSDQDDAVLESGQTKVILAEDYSDIILTADATDYKYQNGQFVKNIQKISDRAIAENAKIDRNDDIQIIKSRMMKIACEQLIAENVNLKKIKCSDFD